MAVVGDAGIERRKMAGIHPSESAYPALPDALCAVLERNTCTQTRPGRHLIASWGFGCKLGVALQSVELCDSSESEDALGQAQVAAFLLSFTLVLCAV